MFQVRIHGRGGQGVVTAAELLSVAALVSGRHAQAFPGFGSERIGAPVVAFCRIDDWPIRSHDAVATPDAVVVQDPTLLRHVDLFAGLSPDGWVVINTAKPLSSLAISEQLGPLEPAHIVTIPATEMAVRLIGRPVPDTALLGALAELTGVVPLAAVVEAIHRRFPGRAGNANDRAATEAAAVVRSRSCGVTSRA